MKRSTLLIDALAMGLVIALFTISYGCGEKTPTPPAQLTLVAPATPGKAVTLEVIPAPSVAPVTATKAPAKVTAPAKVSSNGDKKRAVGAQSVRQAPMFTRISSAESDAFKVAYANALKANALLGAHRYLTSPTDSHSVPYGPQ
jgi:hypothetical protein